MEATFEYGVAALGVHTILILGHSKCGAVTATLEGKPVPGNISILTKALQPGIDKSHQEHSDLPAKSQGRRQAAGHGCRLRRGNWQGPFPQLRPLHSFPLPNEATFGDGLIT